MSVHKKEEINKDSLSRSVKEIVWENIWTLFNVLNFVIAILLFMAKAYTNMLFIVIIVINILISIVQEIKAKKMVDELSLLNRPQVTILKEGREIQIDAKDLVKNEEMVLKSGYQICADAILSEGMIEVNESLLTGESDSIVKEKGDRLFSGSFVIAGTGLAKVTHAGSESYIGKLAAAVKCEKDSESELRSSMQKVTRLTSWLIVPVGVVLFVEAFVLRQVSFSASIVAMSAALLGMLPVGLVLLISVSLANGVIRLSKKKILVQDMNALETLAHVDVLCVDKTGTLTDGNLKVRDIQFINEKEKAKIEHLLDLYVSTSTDNNATMDALRATCPYELCEQVTARIPFSSKRKWGAVCLNEIGTLYLGAPERFFSTLPLNIRTAMEQGFRVVVFGYSEKTWDENEQLPDGIVPLCVILFEDRIRAYVPQTLAFFEKEKVNVKVISGDHIHTVCAIAKKAGLKGWKKAIDLSKLEGSVDYADLCQQYDVFARVTPRQKQKLVLALQKEGHRVAMTGDGVNDLLALKTADCSIAVAQGSDAARQISQIVLLESDFTNLPDVVKEGRKVVHNVTRTAGVFFIKTIYSILLSIFCVIGNFGFPFIPIQITLIDAAMEAYPSFLTIFENDIRPIRNRFLDTAIRNALPFSISALVMMGVVALLPFSIQEQHTMMYILLILTTMAAVIKSCIPFTKMRLFICVSMVIGTFAILWLFPGLLEITALSYPQIIWILLIFCAGMAILYGWSRFEKRIKRK